MGANQTSFKPGQSGNPNGPPKKEWTMGGIIRDSMEEQDETGVSYKLIIARKLRDLARRGDMVAIKEVNSRLDGMPKQSTDLTSLGEKLEITFHPSLKQDEK